MNVPGSEWVVDLCAYQGTQEEGEDSWYRRLDENLGIKIFKPRTGMTRAALEYMLTKYVESSGFTTNALAFGKVAIISPRTHKRMSVPAIWMEHIQGFTFQEILELTVLQYLPVELKLSSLEEQERWAYDSVYFSHCRDAAALQVESLRVGFELEMDDHISNLNNFILQKNGLVRVIDFSLEAKYPKPELRAKVFRVAHGYLSITLPPEPYFSRLYNRGIIIPQEHA